MYLTIDQALGDQYLMFYNANFPCSLLHPVCDLATCILQVNQCIDTKGKNMLHWTAGEQDQAARLCWVNWIYHNLPHDPIRKPLLVHHNGFEFVVDCGDTRLMVLNLLPEPGNIAVVSTCKVNNSSQYCDWVPIRNNQDLINVTGFSNQAQVFVTACHTNHAIDWLEIGDQGTAHHLHDVGLRLKMLQEYINSQGLNFRFDKSWVYNNINWLSYVS
jgi:hypothetical protein